MSTQGLTYPHDLILSRNPRALLRRVTIKSIAFAKLLIFLACVDCRETVQGVRKQDRTSVCGRVAGFAHKVFHRHGGEKQKPPRIKNLPADPEVQPRFLTAPPFACCDDG